MYRSRIRNKFHHNTYLLLLGVIVILGVLIFAGMQLLVKFSILLGNAKSVNEIVANNQKSIMLPPTLNPIDEATHTATIKLSGVGIPGETIQVFVNGKKVTESLVDKEGQVDFGLVRLEQGKNSIKAKAIDENKKESEFSPEETIQYDTTPPPLEVKSPSEGQAISGNKQVIVSGKTEPDVDVTVNNFMSIVDSGGNFSYTLPLNDGDNQIIVVATDKAGNQTQNKLKVTFSQ